MEKLRPLTSCPAKSRGIVAALAPQDARLGRKLRAMGIREGCELVLLQTFPVYVVVCEYAQAAFDAQIARSILLRCVDVLK